jgi:hypothetical protein
MSKDTRKIKIRELDPDLIAPGTATMNKETQGGSKTVVIGKPGCFEPGTPILMYSGEILPVECVKVGNNVMGDDGTPRRVLQLCNNRENMYKIKLSSREKEYYTVNEGHSLVLQHLTNKQTIEISVREYLKKPEEWKTEWKIFRNGVEFSEKSIEVDPYLIGLLLSKTGLPSINDESKKWVEKYSTNEDINIAELLDFSNNILYRDFIPQEYKLNTAYNRLKLLAGIIDSDGWYDNNKYLYHIVKNNELLSNDIVFLARSLGFDAFVSLISQGCYKDEEYFTDIFYQITITGSIDTIPCLVKNKKALEKKGMGEVTSYDFNIELVGEGDYYGFVLDGNHRFLLATFDVVRNTGKSTLISSLLYEKSHIYSSGMVCSGTEDSNHHYSQVFPETFIYNKLEKAKIEDFVKRQKISKKHLPNPWGVLLLDDCTDDPKLFTDPLFQNIFKNGRHYKMWFILSLQYCLDVKPVIRTNIDGTFILRESNLRNRKSLWENYAGVIPDFTMFCDIMDQLTTDYTALYIHNATTSNKIEDCVFWYKAKPVPKDFRFGSQDFWDFHNARFDETKSIL